MSNVVYPFVGGGAEKRIHEIGTRLVERGHDVTVYGRHFWEGPAEMTHAGMTLRAVAPAAELHAGERRSITEALGFAVRTLYPLRRRLQRGEHDVVVASVFPYFPVLSTAISSIGTDTPLVTTWHEVWRTYWEEYLGVLAPFGKLTEQLTARTPQHPIAVSESTADQLAEVGPARERIRVVPNGIDTGQVQSATLPEEGYDVLFAGRLVSHKNVDILLSAFDAVADKYDATLGIIGDGPERAQLESKRDSLTHAGRVDFLGFIDDYEAVLGQMRAADVFASPSTREGFGITLVEAMAADCVVVAASHPDSAADEVVEEAGFLSEPTVDDISEALQRGLAGKRPPMSPTERAERFDWDRVTTKAEKAYRNAIAEY